MYYKIEAARSCDFLNAFIGLESVVSSSIFEVGIRNNSKYIVGLLSTALSNSSKSFIITAPLSTSFQYRKTKVCHSGIFNVKPSKLLLGYKSGL
jgi:hypothetical protein